MNLQTYIAYKKNKLTLIHIQSLESCIFIQIFIFEWKKKLCVYKIFFSIGNINYIESTKIYHWIYNIIATSNNAQNKYNAHRHRQIVSSQTHSKRRFSTLTAFLTPKHTQRASTRTCRGRYRRNCCGNEAGISAVARESDCIRWKWFRRVYG